MKRKRRIEITRYSRRITVVQSGDSGDFIAKEVVADIALRRSVYAPLAPEEVKVVEPACNAAPKRTLRQYLRRFFAWLSQCGDSAARLI
jgi:hypothetical protein